MPTRRQLEQALLLQRQARESAKRLEQLRESLQPSPEVQRSPEVLLFGVERQNGVERQDAPLAPKDAVLALLAEVRENARRARLMLRIQVAGLIVAVALLLLTLATLLMVILRG